MGTVCFPLFPPGLVAGAVDEIRCIVLGLSGTRQFDALRSDSAFQALLEEAEAGRQQARTAFREAGGERLLAGDA